jgi:hypothetical protein
VNSYHFELTIEGVDIMADDVLDALFEAGCDDASFGVSMEIQTGAFHREAADFAEAVASAIKDVESAVPGAQVVGMERLPELAAMQLP